MIYVIFVEHCDSIRSFCKCATTNYETALAEFNAMVEYFSNYCRKGTNFKIRNWPNECCTTYVDCKVIECDEHKHIIHFDKFDEL